VCVCVNENIVIMLDSSWSFPRGSKFVSCEVLSWGGWINPY